MRVGMTKETRAQIDALSRESPEFRRLWEEQDVTSHGEGAKLIRHAVVGEVRLEYSTFSVDGRPDLSLVIFNPATPQDREKIRRLIAG
jgi:hypothetical protein